MMEVKDLVGFGGAIEKFCDVVSGGIGAMYKPRAMRKEADAEAYKVVALARAEAQAEIEKRAIACLPPDSPLFAAEVPLLQRAAARLAQQEMEKQANVESVVEHAEDNLSDDVSGEPVDKGWTTRFFAAASEVSDQLMQEVWGKVLAKEVAKPGSYSLRSLEVLRNLSVAEAETFRRVCSLQINGNVYKSDLNSDLPQFGMTYADLLSLRSAGLVHDGDFLTSGVDLPTVMPYQGCYLQLAIADAQVAAGSDQPTTRVQVQLNALVFTDVGRELSKLIEHSPNWNYIRALQTSFRATNNIELDLVEVTLVGAGARIDRKLQIPAMEGG